MTGESHFEIVLFWFSRSSISSIIFKDSLLYNCLVFGFERDGKVLKQLLSTCHHTLKGFFICLFVFLQRKILLNLLNVTF